MNEDDIALRLKTAEAEKDWGEVDDILYDACDYCPSMLAELLPRYFEYRFWVVRASALEIVGIRQLKQFSNAVAARLRDRNAVVRSYALMTWYELLEAEALSAIDEFCQAKDVGVRLTALVLRYVETGDHDTLTRLGKILKRRKCTFLRRRSTMNIFDHYCDSNPDSNVVQLFESILPDVPEEFGKAEEIRKTVAKWKRNSRRTH